MFCLAITIFISFVFLFSDTNDIFLLAAKVYLV